MKVIHLISGGDTGGARTHVYSLLKYLGQIIDVQLVCFRGGDFADGAAALGIPTMVLGKGFLANLGALKRIIRDGEYDIVHCHGSMANVMGAMLRPSVHVPVISTVHSDYRLDYLGRPFARAVYGTLNTWALHQLDYRVCVSDPIRQRLIDRGFEPNRLFSIYNGLDFSHVVPKTDRAAYFAQFGYTVHEGDVIAGIAARLDPVKDIPTLLRAVALAKKACPQLRLAIAGDGKERKKLEALTKELDLEDSVFFLGWVNDLDSFYGALDINTLSSVSEAFPYALPEGARAHLATVASNVGGVPAIIEHGVTDVRVMDSKRVGNKMGMLRTMFLDIEYPGDTIKKSRNSKVTNIGDHEISYAFTNKAKKTVEKTRHFDSLVIATGMHSRPTQDLTDACSELGIPCDVIGSAKKADMGIEATADAYAAAMKV